LRDQINEANRDFHRRHRERGGPGRPPGPPPGLQPDGPPGPPPGPPGK
jgi:hypothetical protein